MEDLLECAAYTKGVECWEAVKAGKGTGGMCPLGPHEPGIELGGPKSGDREICDCCDLISVSLDPDFGSSERARRDRYCASAAGKTLDPCPFSDDGTIKDAYADETPAPPSP